MLQHGYCYNECQSKTNPDFNFMEIPVLHYIRNNLFLYQLKLKNVILYKNIISNYQY